MKNQTLFPAIGVDIPVKWCKLKLNTEEGSIPMDRTYKQIELVGISEKSYEAAIQNAISKASQSLHGLSWYEIIEQRGRISEGKVVEFQVIIKIALKLD